LLSDEILKALIEGIIYVAPEPVTVDGMLKALEGEERTRVQSKLDELVADYEQNAHGIQIRQVANGYKFSTKAEHHEVLRKYVKSLKPMVRLSKPALETLAVIAYRQPVTIPEIEEIRGVDAGGVIHTLLEKKLVVTAGRKSVVGRPILYRTSKDFLVHFGLKDVGELPSLKEFEELAKRALGAEWAAEAEPSTGGEPVTAAGETPTPASGETDSRTKPEEASAPGVAPSEVESVEPVPATSQPSNTAGVEENYPAASVAPAESKSAEPSRPAAQEELGAESDSSVDSVTNPEGDAPKT
jgi:segregation and condensation protein B